eukprot:CAMPEP_0118976362 /NCGR_PEP_ID=MMETSP1173-20130426/18598_1 /TAXON_ID=1034831 /ORGANISM="Rhizochromulina marina cf, Strain CCMP1243" /LENGTH=64 /DNA_ID=CAMNT_0006926385 /DNA_START=1 /DNA_END=192 /DNA_ORIENTATION=+
MASQEGRLEVVRVLVAAGADVHEPATNVGVTALYMASQEGLLEVVRVLLAAEADVNQARTDTRA